MSGSGPRGDRKPPRRVGVLGAKGQLGRCLVRQIESAPDLELAFALSREELDLSEIEGLSERISDQLGTTEAACPAGGEKNTKTLAKTT